MKRIKKAVFLLTGCILLSGLGMGICGNPVSVRSLHETTSDSLFLERINKVDSSIISLNTLSPLEQAFYFRRKARIYKQERYYSTAISFYDQAIEVLQGFPDALSLRIELILEQNEFYEAYGDYENGMVRLYDLLKLSNGRYPVQEARAYIRLGFYQALLGHLGSAQDNLEQASQIIARIGSEKDETGKEPVSKDELDDLQYHLHNTWAQIWSGIQVDSAFRHLEQAEYYSRQKVQKMQVLYQNEAVLYSYIKDYSSAEKYFRKALALIDDDYQKLAVSTNIAELEYMKGNYERSAQAYQEALAKAEKMNAVSLKIQILKALANIHARWGDFRQAYSLQQQAQVLADSGFVSGNRSKIMDIQRDFELFKLENEKRWLNYRDEMTQLELSRKNLSIMFVSLCLLICVGIIIFIYRRFRRQRQRSDELDFLLNRNISRNRQMLESFRNETEMKTRKLVSSTLSMAKTGEVISEVLTEINRLRLTIKDAGNVAALGRIEAKIRSLDRDENQWENFKMYFEQTHPSFFARLNKAFPTLTAGENRICAFIVMNLTSKEIASLTNRSVRTIDSIKFRIRSKMNIPRETSTLSFLLAFTDQEKPEKAQNA